MREKTWSLYVRLRIAFLKYRFLFLQKLAEHAPNNALGDAYYKWYVDYFKLP